MNRAAFAIFHVSQHCSTPPLDGQIEQFARKIRVFYVYVGMDSDDGNGTSTSGICGPSQSAQIPDPPGSPPLLNRVLLFARPSTTRTPNCFGNGGGIRRGVPTKAEQWHGPQPGSQNQTFERTYIHPVQADQQPLTRPSIQSKLTNSRLRGRASHWTTPGMASIGSTRGLPLPALPAGRQAGRQR